jgi:sulfur carrier protein ThiS
MTMQLNTRLHQCAQNLQYQKLLAKLSAGDVVAHELKYDGACLTFLRS